MAMRAALLIACVGRALSFASTECEVGNLVVAGPIGSREDPIMVWHVDNINASLATISAFLLDPLSILVIVPNVPSIEEVVYADENGYLIRMEFEAPIAPDDGAGSFTVEEDTPDQWTIVSRIVTVAPDVPTEDAYTIFDNGGPGFLVSMVWAFTTCGANGEYSCLTRSQVLHEQHPTEGIYCKFPFHIINQQSAEDENALFVAAVEAIEADK